MLIIKSIATLFGIGFSPILPGTLGTLVAMILYFFTKGNLLILCSITSFLLIAGFPVIATAEKQFGYKDPAPIVLDELIGYMVCMIGIHYSFKSALVGFLIFRIIDIFKPPPIKTIQKLPSSFGIIADDIAAGIYTNILLRFIT